MGRGRVGRFLVAVGAALIAGVMAGCGGGGGGSTPDQSSTGTTTAASPTATTGTETGSRSEEEPPEALGSSAAVRSVVQRVLTSIDPADACGKYVTRHYLEVAYGGEKACVQAQRPGIAATSLSSFQIDSEEPRGTVVSASAVLHGGPYDGSKARVGLVFDSGRYRLNALGANVPVGP